MGGCDKGLIHYEDQPLIERLIEQLKPQVSALMISCNRNFDQYRQYGYTLIRDRSFPEAGPLSGLYEALAHCTTPWLALTPVDTPTLPQSHIDWLISQFELNHRADKAASAAAEPLCILPEDNQCLQPLFAIISTQSRDSLQHYLSQGNRSVKGWMMSLRPLRVKTPEAWGPYTNFNTKEDIAAFAKRSDTRGTY